MYIAVEWVHAYNNTDDSSPHQAIQDMFVYTRAFYVLLAMIAIMELQLLLRSDDYNNIVNLKLDI